MRLYYLTIYFTDKAPWIMFKLYVSKRQFYRLPLLLLFSSIVLMSKMQLLELLPLNHFCVGTKQIKINS